MKHGALKRWGIFCLILSLWIGFPPLAFSQKPTLREVTARRTESGWKVSFSLVDGFNEKTEEAIESGVETIFTFFAEVYQKRPWLWDRKVGSFRFHHTLRFDPIRNEYQVTLGEIGESFFVTTLEEAKGKVSRVEDVEVQLSTLVSPRAPLELRIKAQVDSIRLPFPLEQLLFFVSLSDAETDWYIQPLPP